MAIYEVYDNHGGVLQSLSACAWNAFQLVRPILFTYALLGSLTSNYCRAGVPQLQFAIKNIDDGFFITAGCSSHKFLIILQ